MSTTHRSPVPVPVALLLGALSLACGDSGGDRRPRATIYAELSSVPAPAGPSAVVAGDLDGDGVLEFAVAGSADDLLVVFDEQLRERGTYPVGANPVDIGVGDLDGDGLLDLAVLAQDEGAVYLLLGNGKLGFTPGSAPLQVGAGPTDLELGDLNGDGELDLVTCDEGDGGVSVLLNSAGPGEGFEPAVALAGTYPPESIALADLDGDPSLDLALINRNATGIDVWSGQGDGTFAISSGFLSVFGPTDAVATDVTADGSIDLVVTYSGFAPDDGGVAVFVAAGNGTFQPPILSDTIGEAPEDPVPCDWNGDQATDVIVSGPALGEVTVLLGNGFGSLSAPVSYATGGTPRDLVIRDGARAVAVATSTPDALVVELGPPSYPTGGSDSKSLEVIDLDLDGDLDFLVGDLLLGACFIEGRPDGIFRPERSFDMGGLVNSVTAAHLDADIFLDLVAAVEDTGLGGTLTIITGPGLFGSTNLPIAWATGGSGSAHVQAGPLNGDAHVDLVVANAASDDISVLFGNGDGSLATPALYPVGDGPREILLSYMNGDGVLDIAVLNGSSGDVSVLIGLTDGTYLPETRYAAAPAGTAVDMDLWDTNADGLADLVVAYRDRATSGGVALLESNGDGTYRAPRLVVVDGVPAAAGISTITGSSPPDLLVPLEGEQEMLLFPGKSGSKFAQPTTFQVGAELGAIELRELVGAPGPDAVALRPGTGRVTVLETRVPVD